MDLQLAHQICSLYNSEAHLKGQRREICNPWCVYHTKVLVEYINARVCFAIHSIATSVKCKKAVVVDFRTANNIFANTKNRNLTSGYSH